MHNSNSVPIEFPSAAARANSFSMEVILMIKDRRVLPIAVFLAAGRTLVQSLTGGLPGFFFLIPLLYYCDCACFSDLNFVEWFAKSLR